MRRGSVAPGERFGLLRAVSQTAELSPDGCFIWLLVCACGREERRSVSTLVKARALGCRSSCASCREPPKRGLSHSIGRGDRFGRLVILRDGPRSRLGTFVCACDCGKSCVRDRLSLVRKRPGVEPMCDACRKEKRRWSYQDREKEREERRAGLRVSLFGVSRAVLR